MTYAVVDSGAHEPGPWCWCHPAVRDEGFAIIIRHRPLDPTHLVSRKVYGGERFEVAEPTAQYANEYPDGFGTWRRS